ncbi:MAG: hypothetical protein H6607_10500 [Flavobacteriales bacterium]|nr:hypothetical protein [Flavobacteriales bacterium]
MKKYILAIVVSALSFSNYVFAQSNFGSSSISVDMSEPIDSRKNYINQIFKGDDGTLFSINNVSRNYTLIRYRDDLSEGASVNLSELMSRNAYIENVVCINNGIVVFFSEKDNREKENKLSYMTFDQDDLSVLESTKELSAIKFNSRLNTGNFDVAVSQDSSKILVYANTPYKRAKDANDEVSVVVLTKDFDLIWEKNITLPYEEKDFLIMNYNLDNNGNIQILGRLKKERSERKKKTQNYTFHFISYTDEGKSREEHELKLKENFISSIDYTVKEDGNLLCAGLYSKTAENRASGVFYLELEQGTLDVVSENVEEFGLDFFTEGLSERAAEKLEKKAAKGKEIEFYEFEIRDLLPNSMGGLTMVAEQYYVYTTTTTTTNSNGTTTTRTVTHYIYNDILVVEFDETGEVVWKQKIHKYQHTTDDGGYYSGFNLVKNGETLHFFFVTPLSNTEDIELPEEMEGDKKAKKYYHYIHVEVDENGKKQAETLGYISKKAHRPVVRECVSLKDGTSLVFAKGRKTHQIGLLKTEN